MNAKQLFSTGFWLCLASVLYLTLMPVDYLPDVSVWDKLSHVVAFAVLTLLSLLARFELRMPSTLILIILLGATIELAQILIPGRHFSLLDILADTLGVMLGAIILISIDRKLHIATS